MAGKRSISRYLGRAMMLRCPVCGISRIFLPVVQTRSLRDWFTPLDGCPRCGYPYEREPGYFLASVWLINYGVGSLLGVSIYLFLEAFYHLDLLVLFAAVLTPIALFNFFFARHSKAIFIAVDHLCDPHEKDGGDDGGNVPNPTLPTSDSGGPAKPLGLPVRKEPKPSPRSTVLH